MADQQVNMIVNVISKGSEKLQQVNQDLTKLAKTQTDGTAITSRANEAMTKQTTNLGKQIPVLRELNPIMRQMGLGWLAGASAIAAVSAGAILCNQAFGTWLSSMTGLAVSLNTTTGQTWSFTDALDQVLKLSLDTNIPMNDLAKAYATLNTATHDSAISLDILTEAIRIHKETGIPLKQIVDDLTAAYNGNKIVYDEMKNAIPPGVAAVQELEKQLLASASAAGKLKASIDDNWATTWESVKLSLGALTEIIKIGLSSALLPITNFVAAVKAFAAGEGWVDILGHALGLGGWENVEPLAPGAPGAPTDTTTIMKTPVSGKVFPEEAAEEDWAAKEAAAKAAGKIAFTGQTGPNTWWDLYGQYNSKYYLPGAQYGADVLSGGMLKVGEAGPELLKLPAGAQVAPLDQGRSAGPNILQVYIGNELLSQFVIDDLNTAVRLRGGH